VDLKTEIIKLYGIDIGASLKFEQNIVSIADQISKKKLARAYFGNSPFITPDKKFFVLKKGQNEIILGNHPGPEGKVNLTVRHYSTDKGDFDNIAKITKECCEIITNSLDVEIMRIGSVNELIADVESRSKVFGQELARNILSSDFNYHGGYVKYLYTITPENIGKELNVNLEFDCNQFEEKIKVVLDINNRNLEIGMIPEEVVKIGDYSFDFLKNVLKPMLIEKGLIINE
jgi:hypothetical protein